MAKRQLLHESAVALLRAEILRCEASGEYQEKSKAEGYQRALQLLLEDRRRKAQGSPA